MSNHLSVMIEAGGHDAAMKIKTALTQAGYVIYRGDPSVEIARLTAENGQLRRAPTAMLAWLRRNASAEKKPETRAAFIEAHNALLSIAQEAKIGSTDEQITPSTPESDAFISYTKKAMGHEPKQTEQGTKLPSGGMEQGGISDRLTNFDDWGNRIRERD